MIKYVELTAPNASAFRQAKILSIECQEGDEIKEGDTLFKVQSGSHQINLPAIKAGRIIEIIATVQESITLSTALLLLETEVQVSTASTQLDSEPIAEQTNSSDKQVKLEDQEKQPPISVSAKKKEKPAKKKKAKDKAVAIKHEQQSLNLLGDDTEVDNESTLDGSQQSKPQEVVLTQTVKIASLDEQNTQNPSPTIMSSNSLIEVTVPDIGADSAKVIEILVSVGDSVSKEDPLVTLESDKASMDVPSTHDGVVKSISVKVDEDISEGSLILELEVDDTNSVTAAAPQEEAKATEIVKQEAPSPVSETKTAPNNASSIVDVTIPDIGGDSAKVIEILVKVGDSVEIEDALVTLESDKASMDVPSSVSGTIESIEIEVDQDVSEGTLVVKIASTAATSSPTEAEQSKPTPVANTATTEVSQTVNPKPTSPSTDEPIVNQGKSHASPSIRRFSRELGVDLSKISGSGRKGRITQDDVKRFVKGIITKPASSATASSGTGAGIPAIPAQDFTKFGDVDVQPLNKIKKLTASNLHRAWLNVPHVTHNDESNISDLESFRKQLNAEYAKSKQDIKLSPLAFIVKAMVNALQRFPQFNSSLEPGGENLIYKKYFNIGIAVETPNGLVVPVIKNADKMSVAEIAVEMGELAKKARDKKLTMNDMSGACITISSLGGIGGTSFTPIVNAPEVAILGVARSKMQPVWNGQEFKPGMILPLSLSYDHRVIDGAEAARFTRHIAAVLEDVRRLTV